MQVVLRGGEAGNNLRLVDRRPFDTPPGFRLVVPGLPQLSWLQHERAAVLIVSYLTALVVVAWTWGTWVSWVFLGYAFFAHAVSAADALRQSSFPACSSRTAFIWVFVNLGLLVYLPGTLVLLTLAWPGFSDPETGTGYVVNRWAYRRAAPRPGEWIWTNLGSRGRPHAAQVVAIGGQEVEWTGRNWRIDGMARPLSGSPRITAWPQTCRFHVPSDQYLVEPAEAEESTSAIGPMVLVPSDAIVGRAWARLYPMWDRRLL
jgi:hypothetical protein